MIFFCFRFQMQKVSDEAKLEQIENMLEKIDIDKDGHLKVDDILKVSQKTRFFCAFEFC